MAISFVELESVVPTNGDVVPAEGVLVFDTVVSSAGTQISYNTATGTITFNEAGFYYIDWYVAPYFGLTTDGSNWAIQTALSGLVIIGSSHTKVSVTTGFAILNVVAGETAQLVNVSDGAISLSPFVKSKAGLIVYSVAMQMTSGVGV